MKAILLFFIAIPAWAQNPAAASWNERIAPYWNKVIAIFEDGAVKLDQMKTLPEDHRFGIGLSKTRKNLRADIDKTLVDVAEMLGGSPLADIKKEADLSIQRMRELEVLTAHYQFKLATKQMPKEMAIGVRAQHVLNKLLTGAPGQPRTESDMEAALGKAKWEMGELKKGVGQMRARARDMLKAMGSPRVTVQQVDALLFTVNGTQEIRLISLLQNVRIVVEQLNADMAKSSENIHLARKYYGIYALMTRTLVTFHKRYLEAIADDYLPALEVIHREAGELIKTARALQAEDPDNRLVYESNIKANELTVKTVEAYQNFLLETRRRVAESLDKVEKKYRAAENTFMTVERASDLMFVMNQSRSLFEGLLTLEIPKLTVFQNLEIAGKFLELTQDIK